MSQNLHEIPIVVSDETSPKNSRNDTLLVKDTSNPLTQTASHMSTHDALEQWTSYIEIPDEMYDRLSKPKKLTIVALLSYCSFLAPISSTTILSGIPEVVETYNSSGTIINLSNALYMLFMGISPCFWGPLSQVYGRRWVDHSCLLL